jgi:menaquinone-dependent protoporphyrinogen oxidase
MTRVPVFYATTEGHTRRIAETIAATLREEGLESEALDLSSHVPSPEWTRIASAVVGASIHIGRHQRAASAFVRQNAHHLKSRPAAFFSVSLSAGSHNPSEVDAARGIATKFVQSVAWQPRRLACFAGKLAYPKYGFFTRWLMRRIAAREGAPTDTTRDYDFTDWAAVREFARAVAGDVREVTRAAS